MKLGDLLTKNDPAFFIPPYQRKYEWAEDQCDVFWKDALKVLSPASPEPPTHFFGTALLSVSSKSSISDVRYILVDGQQRITTVFLFLAACRDSGKCPRNLANKISSLLFRSGLPRLEQSETDCREYAGILSSSPLPQNGGRLWENYLFFREKIAGWRGAPSLGGIQDLAEAVLERFTMAVLEPDKQEGDLQDIFESMNSTGSPLSFADLVKNWLLMLPDAAEQKRFFSSCWMPMEEGLGSAKIQDASDFIRSYMEMKTSKSYSRPPFLEQQKLLYIEFKRLFSGIPKEDVLRDLRLYAPLYAQLESARTPDPQESAILGDLNAVKAPYARPFLLLLFSMRQEGRISDSDLLKILKALRVYFLRRRLRGLPHTQEADLAQLPGRIGELLEAPDKEAAVFALLSSQSRPLRLPNDVEVAECLKSMKFCNTDQRRQKFFFCLAEEALTGSRPLLDDPALTVEHIMPKSLSPEWEENLGKDADDIHSRLLDNIGNLTILHCNLQAGNKAFKEKKEIYASQDGLQLSRRCIEDCAEWDESAILRRQEWLTSLFLKSILPVLRKYRESENYILEAAGN